MSEYKEITVTKHYFFSFIRPRPSSVFQARRAGVFPFMGLEFLIKDNGIRCKAVWELVHKQAFTKSVKYSDKSNNPINGVL